MPRQSIFDMPVSKIYPLLLQKAERKGRTKAELDEVIRWLTGYDMGTVDQSMPYGAFFENAVLHELQDNGGAYVPFPWDIRKEFGKGRVKVHAIFDGVPYNGSIVNMGVKNADGSVCYIIGVLKSIRTRIGKKDGDMIHVVIEQAGTGKV